MVGGSGGARVGGTQPQRAQFNYLSVYVVGPSCGHGPHEREPGVEGSGILGSDAGAPVRLHEVL